MIALVLAVVSRVLFSFTDPAITESSGLVDLGALMVTTNDSGDDAVLYTIDPRTGKTVGRTTYARSVTDVEALAPAGPNAVWAADIGDNTEVRRVVEVYKVPVGRGHRRVDAPSYRLQYPDGPHDAESLIAGPDGRLRIVSKSLAGGYVYVAPKVLRTDRPNRLVRGPAVDLWATDAALFPDGRHVLVRGYDSAVIATFPKFEPVAIVDLPAQVQGEGVSIGDTGRIRLSSEGEHSAVLQVTLPADVQAALKPTPSASPNPTPDPVTTTPPDDDGSGAAFGIGAGCLAALAVALWWARRRSR